MSGFFARLKSGHATAAAIAAIFAVGFVAGFDYWQLRADVVTLVIDKASRDFWRLKKRIDAGTANMDEIAAWCDAATRLNYGCDLKGVAPASWLVGHALAGGAPPDVSADDRAWFFNTTRRHRYWLDNGAGRFVLSADAREDRELKDRYCAIGEGLAAEYGARMRRSIRFRCPRAFR